MLSPPAPILQLKTGGRSKFCWMTSQSAPTILFSAIKNGHQTSSAEARFRVKLLFVNVFSYRHQNEEIWRDNCLASINAETLSNGTEFAVRGQAANEGFQVQAESSANKLPPCVMSFAYWNPEFLKSENF
tara:strand:+ start:348 stop:737 length:390 start_codon:yes stop_codon:yes gene_type:complete